MPSEVFTRLIVITTHLHKNNAGIMPNKQKTQVLVFRTKHTRSFAGNISSLSRYGESLSTNTSKKKTMGNTKRSQVEKKIIEINRMKHMYKVGKNIQKVEECATSTGEKTDLALISLERASPMKDTLEWLETLDFEM
jgi:conjugal transfer/entry exclusion protein